MKPPKYEILAFIKQEKQYYKPTALGFRILDYLEDLVKRNAQKKTSQHKGLPTDKTR